MTLKVLFVINGLGTGGAERSIAEMIPGLIDGGVEATVVCLNRRDEGVERSVVAQGTAVHFLRGRTMVSRTSELRRLIRELRPDIVHTTLFEATVVGRLAAIWRPTTVLTSLVNTTYDPVRLQDPNVRARSLRAVQAVDSVTARHLTGHFHAITRAVKDAAVRDLRISADKVTVIERGRDPGRLGRASPERRRSARDALGLAYDAPVLVNVARQEFQKGQAVAVRALAELRHTRPDATLLIAGRTGDATAELELLRDQLGLQEHVVFLGHRDDVPDVLAAADVFVFPSVYEGLGCAVIEAMALGLPVVASDVPALREVLEDGGNAVLVPTGSADALHRAIAGVLEDPGRAGAYGARSRTIFEERFTLAKSTARMAELYRRIVSPSRPSGRMRGRRAVL